jgi:predicted transposase YdaD
VARDFTKNYLPPEVVKLLDLDTLDISKDSFIDSELKRHFSDLLYKVSFRDKNGNQQQAYIYLLFDHKSYVDKWVGLQLFDYMSKIWDLSFKQQETVRKEQRQDDEPVDAWYLPPIFPLVVYHGERRWTASTEFIDLFKDLPDALRPYMPNYRYFLYDLSDYSDDEITDAVILQVGMLLLKYIYSEELFARLPGIIRLLNRLSDSRTALGYFETLIWYVSSGAKHLTEQQLVEVVKEIFEEKGGDIMPTIAETWMERGRVEGLELGLNKGRVEGLERGRVEGLELGLNKGRVEGLELGLNKGSKHTMVETVARILAIRFIVEMDHYEKELKQLPLEVLKELTEPALTLTRNEFEALLRQKLRRHVR